ncbi:MAG TPA: nicotinate-nucleotide diphosphorylase (carboxylating), partial [Actinomycetota bacterium]|nr:nicotinate-nucleotide diphosphorylase (carboxylating) [Actinomycetota bacterium]
MARTPGVIALPHEELEELARRALAEDLGDAGDITTKRVVRIDQPGRGRLIAKGAGVLAGAPLAGAVFHAIDRGTIVDWMLKDGDA